ncbi:hypothetical protein B0H67DRAFT_328477 [Lasiosphaeris hirsuta]|uniref:Uncharacterized protein n=1 Tax=Lasiosphaeris hirsuta TaxID=260670 RepID=A0AA40A2I7_9PEZI|nr:hypothetical protein B0H67DRAFT_328477 [Lasiosphaeris hirsuta]
MLFLIVGILTGILVAVAAVFATPAIERASNLNLATVSPMGAASQKVHRDAAHYMQVRLCGTRLAGSLCIARWPRGPCWRWLCRRSGRAKGEGSLL